MRHCIYLVKEFIMSIKPPSQITHYFRTSLVTIKKGNNELTLRDNDDDVVDIIITFSYNFFLITCLL